MIKLTRYDGSTVLVNEQRIIYAVGTKGGQAKSQVVFNANEWVFVKEELATIEEKILRMEDDRG